MPTSINLNTTMPQFRVKNINTSMPQFRVKNLNTSMPQCRVKIPLLAASSSIPYTSCLCCLLTPVYIALTNLMRC